MHERLMLQIMPQVIIDDNGCWLWQGRTDKDGYGVIWTGGKTVKVHRIVYQAHGNELPDDKLLCHNCDIKNCCNPKHVFVGTNEINIMDAVLKGKLAKTLTKEKVISIREDQRPLKVIAKEHNITRTTASRVKRHLTWGWV